MKTAPIRHSIALASLLALVAGAQAQEAGAWEMRGPPAATSSVSREQVVSVVMWARAQGWRPASEASSFEDEASSPDRRRMARVTHARTVAMADLRKTRKSRVLERDPDEAVARDDGVLRERQAPQEREALSAEPDRPVTTAATTSQTLAVAGALSSGTEAAAGSAQTSPVAASAGPTQEGRDLPIDGSGRLPDDGAQLPMAPGRETAMASPVRPGLAEGSDSPASDAPRGPEAAPPPESPAAAFAQGESARMTEAPIDIPASSSEPTRPLADVDGPTTAPEAASTQPVDPQPPMQASDLAPQSR